MPTCTDFEISYMQFHRPYKGCRNINHNYVNRFGHDWDPHCMKMDETLFGCAEKVKNFATIYLVDISKVPGVTSKAFLITC